MNCVAVATLIVSCIGVGVAIWGVCSSKKSSRQIMQQNRQDKIDWINSELHNINEEIRRAEMRGYQLTGSLKRQNENTISSLKNRKADLLKQLEQLKNTAI